MREPELWESKWKRFLYEGMSPQAIDGKKLGAVFDYFHVSGQKLSQDDFFEFTPRVPRSPYSDFEGNVTEDDFSKRISVAPYIHLALMATDGQFDGDEWIHLYAGTGQPDADARQKDCPETDEMGYDTDFIMTKWLNSKSENGDLAPNDNKDIRRWVDRKNRTIRPRILPDYLKQDFEQCVPDADETKEQWLTKPTTLVYVGTVNVHTQEVLLSSVGLQLVQKANVKTYEY